MNTTTETYVPGVCNINRAEIAYRRKAGFFGLGLLVVVAVVSVLLGFNRWINIILFIPAFIAAIGFLQARNRFCVSYGASGQQNATDGNAKASKVTNNAAIAKDKKRSRQMNLQAAGIALLVTIIAVIAIPLV